METTEPCPVDWGGLGRCNLPGGHDSAHIIVPKEPAKHGGLARCIALNHALSTRPQCAGYESHQGSHFEWEYYTQWGEAPARPAPSGVIGDSLDDLLNVIEMGFESVVAELRAGRDCDWPIVRRRR